MTTNVSPCLFSRTRFDCPFNQFQYYHKYCSRSEDFASISMLQGLAIKLSGWWWGGAIEGLAIGAGVDERLVRGLSEEVHGFSGREARDFIFVKLS